MVWIYGKVSVWRYSFFFVIKKIVRNNLRERCVLVSEASR